MYIARCFGPVLRWARYEAQQRQSLGVGAPQQHVTPDRRDVEDLQKEE